MQAGKEPPRGPPHAQYFEGVLQLRNPSKEVMQFVEDACAERHVFITNRVPQPNGIDLYLTSQRFLHTLSNRLARQFTGELKVSPQLFSRDSQTSKNIYRLNVLFREFKVRTGDVLEIRGRKLKITSIGANISATDISSGKRVIVDPKEIDKALKG
jgi:NMD protein affecting ribosome stability and mRNA decay